MVVLALLTALMVVLFGAVVIRLVEHHLVTLKRAQGRTALLAMQANLDLRQGFGPAARPDMARFVNTMAQNLELSTLVIVNGEQIVIGHSQPDMIGLVLAEDDLLRAMKSRKLIHRLVGEDTPNPELILSGPLYQGGAVIGAARFTLPLDDLYAALSGTRRILFLYALLDAVAVILFGSLVLWRLLVQPVEQLVAATEKMAGGDYRVHLPDRSDTEIGRLGRALSKLAATLSDRERINKRHLVRVSKINEELRQAHDQLLHTDRLAYVGRVAAGVAHEVGNPLGAIFGYLDILREADLDAEEREAVERLGNDVGRIDTIMRELLDFSRVREPVADRRDVLAVAREAVGLLSNQRGLDHIEVAVDGEGTVPCVWLDAQQFLQVMLNVLINAADAMNGVGQIRVHATSGPFDRLALMEAQLPGAPGEDEAPFTDLVRRGIVLSETGGPVAGRPVVCLHVTDSGPGMSGDVLAQMFDPFYTTKPMGKGTGLGMAICQRIMASVGGLMRVESRPAQGTRVTLVFPAVEEGDDHGRSEADSCR